ncbi:hypothetical protein [Glaciecola sp. 33A]|jgi:hypothetical protein|uniref:hypothetical protein n=1 Tax=Glaciecola sp. 33A TaxID=2057807 RepID=UPI000C34CF6A|nr:hypothetical protein [Glaciecola sp. 33A]PKI03389.1 hypothetical protein CXF81_01200 [Glaciecola sp. 33A]
MRLALLCLTLAFLSFSIHAESNSGLKKHFEADQQIRSAESRQNGNTPDLKDEIARRLYVFSALANGDLNTADDFFYASIILQHTNLEFVAEELKSMSNENHLLAYYLAQKAYQLGHEKGAWLIAATYNRYLENAAIDVNKYGLKYDNTRVYLQNNSITDEERILRGLPPVQSVLFSK